MPETTTLSAKPVRFRLDRLQAEFDHLGLIGIREQARYLGVAPSTISRMTRGTQKPSFEFLSRLRQLWPKRDTDYWLDYGDASTLAKAA